jgi:putative FmdB family regulatory protein
MPIYVYSCLSCGSEFERIQMFIESSLTRCPECHLSTVRRKPQLPAIIFRGSGWYSIDHRPPSGQKAGAPRKMNNKAGSIINEEGES